jgi:predicted AlkP superfamily phosphohydrolase/phosphomutase
MTDAKEPPPRRKLLVIGLDGVPPETLLAVHRSRMPNVSAMLDAGVSGAMRTTDPPISLPAWAVMFTGYDPGSLGFYGFRHRLNHSYTQNYVPRTTLLEVPTLYSLLSDRGRRVGVIGMPPGYPPPELNGFYISDFLTPPESTDTTYPAALRGELESRYGKYRFDVPFRAEERSELYHQILEMTRQRWQVTEALYTRETWDLFAVHEIGTDRLHHAFWKYIDPAHPKYVAGNPFAHVADDYFRQLDQWIGRLVSHIDSDTLVAVVSDHGMMPMLGCFCINQWLIEKGYLVLKGEPPAPGTPLEKANVDWSRSRAWGAGGYYARIFFNLRGRESEGIVAPEELPGLRAQLERDLRSIPGPTGSTFPIRILDPRSIYRETRGDPPDLMVYFDDLRWRSAGTLGHPTNYLEENDTGPDDAVHGIDGVYLLYDPNVHDGRTGVQVDAVDVMPTLLAAMGEEVPPGIQGRPVRDGIPRPG